MVFIASVPSGDISLGNLVFAMGSTINDIECADVNVISDSTVESVEEFSIYVSNASTFIEVFPADSATSNDTEDVTLDAISLPLSLPCENTSIIIDTSDTNG